MGVPYDQDLVNLYRSKRLIYRAVEDTSEADKKFILEMNNDPVNAAFASLAAPKPLNTGTVTEFFKRIKESPLMVLACLPPQSSDAAVEGVGETADEKEVEPTPIGFVSLFNPFTGGHITHHRSAMLGISVHAPFRGRGFGGEMIDWCLDWGFRRAGLHRIELGAWSFNHNALKLYRSLGFVEEGREREALWFDRGWHDIVRMGMLEGEWEVLRGIGPSSSSQ